MAVALSPAPRAATILRDGLVPSDWAGPLADGTPVQHGRSEFRIGKLGSNLPPVLC